MTNFFKKYTVPDWILISIILIFGFSVFFHPGLPLEAAIQLGLGWYVALLVAAVAPLCRDSGKED